MGIDRARGSPERPRGGTERSADAGEPFAAFSGRLPSTRTFYTRVRRSARYAFALVGTTLLVGMVGYHWIEHLGWLDAFHQAAMLLSGMGPVVELTTTAGKIFDGVYALFCGIVLLAGTALLFAPVFHRILHRFHIEDSRDR
jgi:hypothetical protein